MRVILMFLVLLLASLAPPVSYSAHRRVPGGTRRAPCQHQQPIRVLRTPQGPKVVRAVK